MSNNNNHHAPSFLFSLIVHIVAMLIVYSTYKSVNYVIDKKEKEKLCINLQTSVANPEQIVSQKRPLKHIQKPPKEIKKQTLPKEQPKVKKTVPKKHTPLLKKVTQKKRVLKKKIEQKIAPKPIPKVPLKQTQTPIKKIISDPKKSKSSQSTQKVVLNKKQLNKEKYINNNLNKISNLLKDNLYYPRRARKRGIVGEVVVSFKIDTKGSVKEVKSVTSSSEILSRAAVKTIKDLSGKFPKPNEDLILQVPINYSLAR